MSLKESLKKSPFVWSACIKTYSGYARIRYAAGNFLTRRTHLYFSVHENEINGTAKIDASAWIAPNGVRIGERCVIGPHVVIHEKTSLDDDVMIGAGSVISSEGFVMKRVGSKTMSIVHAGGVHIHRRAVVGQNCGIDKARTKTWTEIGEDSEIGDFVHIAHNVRLGRRNQIACHAIIAGHVDTGDDVQIGENASITSRIRIGNDVRIAPGAVVTREVPDHARLAGNFAIDEQKLKVFASRIAKGAE